MPDARLEMLVEPFRENEPGPHVLAVVDAAKTAGLDVDMGPFSTTVSADLGALVAVAGDLLRAGFDAGATSIQLRLERDEA